MLCWDASRKKNWKLFLLTQKDLRDRLRDGREKRSEIK